MVPRVYRALAILVGWGVVWLGACDARPLRHAGLSGGGDAAIGDPADAALGDLSDGAGVIEPARQRIATGDFFSCALRADGTAACWGFNGSG